jgi:hypothetical protein
MRSSPIRGTRLLTAGAAVAGAAYLFPLLVHSAIGFFSRYMADDFCTAAVVRAVGLVQAERYWYLGWSGRYAFIFLVDVAGLIGPAVAPVLPALLIALWLAALTWSLTQLTPWVRLPAPLAALLAIVVVSATISAIPNVAQSLYWRNSALTYTVPVVLGSLLAGVVARQTVRPGHPAGWLMVLGLAFFAGGFSEIYTALQFALFGLGLAAALVGALRGRPWRTCGPGLAGLLGSAAALAAIALAPGTHSRQATFSPPPGLWSLFSNSRLYSGWFVRDAFLQHAPSLLAVAALCALAAVYVVGVAADQPVVRRRWLAAGLLLLPVITFGLLVVCYAPAFYALLYLPPDRVLIINWFLFVAATAIWGFLTGLLAAPALRAAAIRLPQTAIAAVLVVLAGLVAAPPIAAAMRASDELGPAQSFASTWDSYDPLLKAAHANGAGSITLARLNNPGGIDNFSDDPQFWTNQCAAQYYGVQVRAIAPPPPPTATDLAQRIPMSASIGGIAQILGYRLDQSSVRAGETLTVTVYWLPTANTDRPYTVFVHLYDPATGSLGQFDGYPGQGQYLTTVWIHGQPFADTYRVPVRAGTRAANAVLILGLYDLQTSRRLLVSGANAGPPGQDWAQFGQIQVTP